MNFRTIKLLLAGFVVSLLLVSHAFALTVNTNEIADLAVTTPKIADGAVTDAKIAGTISRAKTERPANVAIVAKSGGDFSSIQAAIDNVSPTADNPCLIKVMPGTYNEYVTLYKSHVSIQGSGQTQTILAQNIQIYNATDFTLSGVTIKGAIIIQASSGIVNNNTVISGGNGIDLSDANVRIEGNTITSNWSPGNGININGTSNPTIVNNTIENFGFGIGAGIYSATNSATILHNFISKCQGGIFFANGRSTVIAFNKIIGNGGNQGSGIWSMDSDMTIADNIIENHVAGMQLSRSKDKVSGNRISNCSQGITMDGDSGTPLLVHNIATGAYYDMWIAGGAPVLNFNTYDHIYATGAVAGKYNVDSKGNAVLP